MIISIHRVESDNLLYNLLIYTSKYRMAWKYMFVGAISWVYMEGGDEGAINQPY